MRENFSTLIVGYGAAALRCADALYRMGFRSIALVCERRAWGTSRNTGSDKQTYYKLQLGGSEGDSVRQMASMLFSGGAVDGEHAMQEAALSAESFLHLVDLGVPFPRNRWGEYIGYRTDHDEAKRATSAGPYTSRFMVEALERALDGKVTVLEHEQLCKILVDGGQAKGIVCFNDQVGQFDTFYATHIVLATGGPAHCFESSVYPASQHGASGIAYLAGCQGRNLTEWQQGLASLRPRWNVSGTYMQAIPRFVSTDADGGDAREFLLAEPKVSPSLVFLKGYQWPFDVEKAMEGSSLIDLLVADEIRRGRKVWLDFRTNPGNLKFEALSLEAREYLVQADALSGTPIQRLRKMNEPAYQFYKDHGVDLEEEMLEIALCVQHSNGGISVDGSWMSDVRELYVIGEAACTHGIKRPGGSALNASQVGALKAARSIARKPETVAEMGPEDTTLEGEVVMAMTGEDRAGTLLGEITHAMTQNAAVVRDKAAIEPLLQRVESVLADWPRQATIAGREEIGLFFRLKDVLAASREILVAMQDYIDRGMPSRGSSLYTDSRGKKPSESLPDSFRFRTGDVQAGLTQVVRGNKAIWRPVHPLPAGDDFFEVVWKEFREGKG